MAPESTETKEAEGIQPFIRWLGLRPLWALGMACLVTIALSYGLTRLGVQSYARRDDPQSKSRDVARSGRWQALIALAWVAAIAWGAFVWGVAVPRWQTKKPLS